MESPRRTIGLYQPYPHTFGGVQSIVLKLARSLPSHGCRPIVISPQHGAFTDLLEAEGVDYFVCDPGPAWNVYGRGNRAASYLASPVRVATLFHYWLKLRSELRQRRIDLLHCNDYRGVLLAAPAARLARIPALWHMHGFLPSRLANFAAAQLVHRTIPVSQGMLEYLRLPRWTLGRCEVIHNGMESDSEWADDTVGAPASCPTGTVRLHSIHPVETRRSPAHASPAVLAACAPPPPATADHLPPSPDSPVVLAAGALHPRKGYETLIRAFAEVVSKVPHAECWIAGAAFGDGSYATRLRSEARHLGLEGRVKFLGHTDDLPALLRQCRVLAIPSNIEAFGMVAIEAMIHAKPVVACRTGGLPEIVEHGQTGVLVNPNDPESMAGAIIDILSDRSLARAMGQAGRHRALTRFTLHQMAGAFARSYNSLLQTSPAPCPRLRSA